MQLSTICDRLDDRLRTGDYAEVDASANGLQVGAREGDATHVAFAVDAAAATIDAAVDAGADLLVTHHGIVWGGLDRVTGRDYDLVERLIEGGVALYVSHLPLDGHQQLGNAAGLADRLGLEDRRPFGEMGDEHVGQRGRMPRPSPLEDVRATLADELPTGRREVRVLDFGPEPIEEVAIVTGSGTDWLDEAETAGADLLLTGEGKQQVYHRAREAGVNVVLAGHYATETGGVRALQSIVEEWGLETTYVEHPTGL